jgi:hypothetical protein
MRFKFKHHFKKSKFHSVDVRFKPVQFQEVLPDHFHIINLEDFTPRERTVLRGFNAAELLDAALRGQRIETIFVSIEFDGTFYDIENDVYVSGIDVKGDIDRI